MTTRLLIAALTVAWALFVAVPVSRAQINAAAGPFTIAANGCVDTNTQRPVQLAVGGMGTATVVVNGTYTGTLTWTVSAGGDFSGIQAWVPSSPSTTSLSTSSTGMFTMSVASMQTLRICMTGWSAGAAIVYMSASGTGGGGGGGGGGGDASEATLQQVDATLDSIYALMAADAVHDNAAIATGPQMMAVGSTATPTAVSTDGDTVRIWADLNGRLHSVTEAVEDAAETAGGLLSRVGAVQRNVAASSAGSTGDNATINVDTLGLLWTRQLDPCSGIAKTQFVVNLAAASVVEIANAVSNEFFYICSINLVAAGANNVLIAEDDTDNCVSLSAGLNGGTTAATGWNFAANGGIALGNGTGTIMKTTTVTRYLCILPSAATQLSGTISYVSAP